MERITMDHQDQTKSMPHCCRLQIRIIKMAKEQSKKMGLSVSGYLSQLIVKDSEGG